MRSSTYLVILTFASLALGTGCGNPQLQQVHPPGTPARLIRSDLTGKLPAGLAAEKLEYTPVASTGVERVVLYVTVPPDLDRSQLQEALKASARTMRDLSHAGAVMVLGYRRGDDPAVVGAFSAGRIVYAPHGRWEDASTTAAADQWSEVIDLADSYFARKEPASTVSGEVHLLAGTLSSQVKLSSAPDEWDEGHIVATVTAGTLVEVLDSKEFPVGGSRMIRYRVKVKVGPAAGKEGWVFEQNVKPK